MNYVQNKAVQLLKQNFSDCTFGGEDIECIMYDVTLENTYAHIDIYKNDVHPMIVKIYDPESDDEPIADVMYFYGEDVVEYLKLNTWRQVWNRRRKLTNGSKPSVEKWIEKNQREYDEPIFIDKHPKDGWVAYLQPISLKYT